MLPQGIESICNYFKMSDSIGTAGQPTPVQFTAIRAAGYDVVVNLAMPDSTNALPNEHELVAEQGMEYVHLPVVWEHPTDADLDRFFEIMRQHGDRKVLVHCALNWRVSCFMLLYRVIVQGVPISLARQVMESVWEPDDVWEDFISRSLARYGVEL